MLTIVLKDSIQKSKEVIGKYQDKVKAFEVRIDLMEDFTIENLSDLVKTSCAHFIFTLRMRHQGGLFTGSFDHKIELLNNLMHLNPAYVDLEADTPCRTLARFKKKHPKTKIILSYHVFKQIDCFNKQIKKLFCKKSDLYKFCFYSKDIFDNFKIFDLSRKLKKSKKKFILIMMGEKGRLSRLLSENMGNHFTLCAASHDEFSIKHGQLTFDELKEIDQINNNRGKNPIYALLGNPVSKSPSHFTHNQVFSKLPSKALYLKIELEKSEFARFVRISKKYGFKGFSVTSPFKELAFKLCDKVELEDKNGRSINTLKLVCGKWLGKNTDQLAVLKLLGSKINLANSSILMIGCGGYSRALSAMLKNKKSLLFFTNKTLSKAHELASIFRGEVIDFFNPNTSIKFDVVIQATTAEFDGKDPEFERFFSHSIPICIESIITPQETFFIQKAKKQNFQVVYGYEVFLHQAALQFSFWLEIFDEDKLFELLKKSYFDFTSSSSFFKNKATSFQNTRSKDSTLFPIAFEATKEPIQEQKGIE